MFKQKMFLNFLGFTIIKLPFLLNGFTWSINFIVIFIVVVSPAFIAEESEKCRALN